MLNIEKSGSTCVHLSSQEAYLAMVNAEPPTCEVQINQETPTGLAFLVSSCNFFRSRLLRL